MTVDGQSIDHATLAREVGRLADQLRRTGLGPSDRIAIVLGNGPEMVLVLLAVMSVGCSAPLNPKYREDEFRFYLDDLGAAAMITVEGASPAADAAAPEGVIPIHLRGEGLAIDLVPAGSRPASSTSDRRPTGDDHALVLHTSGTTSRPKIVPLRQRNLAASARNIAAHLQLTPADRSLEVMPLFHIHGIMAGLLAPLSAGGVRRLHSRLRCVQVPPLARRAAADVLQRRADHASDGARPGRRTAHDHVCASSGRRQPRFPAQCSTICRRCSASRSSRPTA